MKKRRKPMPAPLPMYPPPKAAPVKDGLDDLFATKGKSLRGASKSGQTVGGITPRKNLGKMARGGRAC